MCLTLKSVFEYRFSFKGGTRGAYSVKSLFRSVLQAPPELFAGWGSELENLFSNFRLSSLRYFVFTTEEMLFK
jgi:hypothetical protein